MRATDFLQALISTATVTMVLLAKRIRFATTLMVGRDGVKRRRWFDSRGAAVPEARLGPQRLGGGSQLPLGWFSCSSAARACGSSPVAQRLFDRDLQERSRKRTTDTFRGLNAASPSSDRDAEPLLAFGCVVRSTCTMARPPPSRFAYLP